MKVHRSGWQFDQILCLARGGVRVGDVLSRIFDVPLGILATSSYREAAGTKQGALDIAQFITITRGTLAGRVLLVDDMVDTGPYLQPRDGAPAPPVSRHHRNCAAPCSGGRDMPKPSPIITWTNCSPIPGSTSLSRTTTVCGPISLEAWTRKGSTS